MRRLRCRLFHRTHFGHKPMEDRRIDDIRVRCSVCRWCGRRWMVITPVPTGIDDLAAVWAHQGAIYSRITFWRGWRASQSRQRHRGKQKRCQCLLGINVLPQVGHIRGVVTIAFFSPTAFDIVTSLLDRGKAHITFDAVTHLTGRHEVMGGVPLQVDKGQHMIPTDLQLDSPGMTVHDALKRMITIKAPMALECKLFQAKLQRGFHRRYSGL